MIYTHEWKEIKHPRGYGTIHNAVVCPECGAVLAECGWDNGECNLNVPKPIRWWKCTEMLVNQKTCIGLKAGL